MSNPTAQHIAQHLKGVFFGGNWTDCNLKDSLVDVTWQEAVTAIDELNTIATLFNHITYFVPIQIRVLEGGPVIGKDSESFAHPTIENESDWSEWLEKTWPVLHHFVELVSNLPDDMLFEDFTDPKYGNYYRNLNGLIEHTHYHLGQISLIKKILRQ